MKQNKENSIMNKNTFQTVKLAKGEMNIYDFGNVKLHAYKTNDFLNDEVFIVEKNNKAVIIESPCFFDNSKELTEYLKNIEVAGMLIAYHGAGAAFLPNVPKYATRNAVDFSQNGGGKALIDNFTGAFGEIFDSSVHKITNVIEAGKITIGGIDFIIKQTNDAFDVEIPEINTVYTHMLGHDCHSLIINFFVNIPGVFPTILYCLFRIFSILFCFSEQTGIIWVSHYIKSLPSIFGSSIATSSSNTPEEINLSVNSSKIAFSIFVFNNLILSYLSTFCSNQSFI